MTSKRTVKFEFLVDADARGIDKFHDSLKRFGDGVETSEKTLGSLREEIQRYASITDKTENSLQNQIAALNSASKSADLTKQEYIKLRTEAHATERTFKELTTGVVGLGKAYEQAGRQAEAFDRRAKKIRERQQYINTSEGAVRGQSFEQIQFGSTPQVARNEQGALIGFPAPGSTAQPIAPDPQKVAEAFAVINEITEKNFQLKQGFYSREAQLAQQELATQQEADQKLITQHRQLADAEGKLFQERIEQRVKAHAVIAQLIEGDRRLQQEALSFQAKMAQEEDTIRDRAYQREQADYKRSQQLALDDFDKRLESASKKKAAKGARYREIGQVAQQFAIGGFFGGPEGALGSFGGAVLGAGLGPGGMMAGAQAGASVGLAAQQLRMSATGVAELSAQLNLAKTTLAQVSVNQADYNQKLSFARQVSGDYTVELQNTIEGYSRVTAAAAANGLTLKETQTIYKGMIASGIAFGASQDDIKGIVLATTQVLSKGKISAEEVNQIAERVPGAFVRLAQATGRSTAQLSNDLQKGQVKISDFVKFATAQFNDYDAAAKTIGSGPEKAGERLSLALTKMNEAYGGFFAKTGAWFQDNTTAVVNWANSSSNQIATFVGLVKWAAKEISSIQVLNPFSGIGGIFNKVDLGVFKPSADSVIGSALTPFLRGRNREGQAAMRGFVPKTFGNAPPTLIQDAADDEKAQKKADAEAKRQQAAFDREQSLQEQLASEKRKQQEIIATNAVKLADRVFEHERSLLRRRQDLELSLIEATARAREAALIGPAREGAALGNRLDALVRAARQETRSAADAVTENRQSVKSAQEQAKIREKYMAMPQSAVGAPVYWDRSSNSRGGGGGSAGVYRQGGWGPRGANAYGAHFDIARPDGSYFERNALDPYVRVNGAPLSRGYTVPGPSGGSFGANRPRGIGAHRAWDYAFSEGAGLTLTGGAKWTSNSPSDYGDRTAFMTPDGKTYRLIHGKFEGQVSSLPSSPNPSYPTLPGEQSRRTAAGVASGRTQYLADKGDIDLAKKNLENSIKERDLLKAKQPGILEQQIRAELEASTEGYRQETQSIKDQLQELKDRNRLRMEGVKPEIIEQQVKLNQESLKFNRIIEQQREELKNIDDPELIKNRLEGIQMQTRAYEEQRRAQEEINTTINEQKYTFDFKSSARDGIDGYIQSIGTLNEAVTNLTQKGFGGVSNALKDLMTTGSADFRAFAVNMLTDTTEIIIQQMVVANLAQMIRGLLGGAMGGVGGAMGGQFNVTDWSGVASYAGGGYTGNAPRIGGLDGKGGRLAMVHPQETIIDHAGYTPSIRPSQVSGGGGGHTINMSIDATGTKAASDPGEAQALGDRLREAVQAELLRQQYGGGTLYTPGQ